MKMDQCFVSLTQIMMLPPCIATTLVVVAIMQTGLFRVANCQTVQSIADLKKTLASRRLYFGNSTIQKGECVAVPDGETLTLTIEILETPLAEYFNILPLI